MQSRASRARAGRHPPFVFVRALSLSGEKGARFIQRNLWSLLCAGPFRRVRCRHARSDHRWKPCEGLYCNNLGNDVGYAGVRYDPVA